MMVDDKLLVYVAGPLTVGDVNQNVRTAMETATKLFEEGYDVILPHLNIFLERFWEEEDMECATNSGSNKAWGYKEWLDYDFHLLSKCDVLYRIQGESPGSDREEAFAMGRGIPVFNKYHELKSYRNSLKGKK